MHPMIIVVGALLALLGAIVAAWNRRPRPSDAHELEELARSKTASGRPTIERPMLPVMDWVSARLGRWL